jgi:hypothetical protein
LRGNIYKLLVLMLIAVNKGASMRQPPSVEGELLALFDDDERLTELLSDMLADSSWEVGARRVFGGDPGTKQKTKKARFFWRKLPAKLPIRRGR